MRKDWTSGRHIVEVICITTSGFVSKSGCAVMGRGTARQAMLRFPGLARRLGDLITANGNVVQLMGVRLVAFPVKPVQVVVQDPKQIVRHLRERFKDEFLVPGWAVKASMRLIDRSLQQLDLLRQERGWEKVYLPRPGCGAGELRWKRVKQLCEGYGDWLVVVTR